MADNKDKRKVRSFSLNTEDDMDILNKLESIESTSIYIKKLIREDIANGSSFTKEQRDEIKAICNDPLKDKYIVEEIKILLNDILKDKCIGEKEDIEVEDFDKDADDFLNQF